MIGAKTDEGLFQIESELGRGAMGAVYQALELSTGRRVAIKRALGGSERQQERFHREAQVLASLQHPGILTVHAVGTLRGQPYLACELVPSARTLDVAFRSADLETRVAWVQEAAQALGYAHAQGCLHRDVKPENLLVDAEGRVRVADFGVASSEALERMTRSGAFVGTPAYMAPEMVVGKREAWGATLDVWSLGVVLYEAIVGEAPFRGESMVSLVASIAEANPERPRLRNPQVPTALEAICLKALSARPEDRYANGTELWEDLVRYREGEAVQAPLTVRRLRPLALWVVGVGTLAVAGAVLATRPSPGPGLEEAPLGSSSGKTQASELASAYRGYFLNLASGTSPGVAEAKLEPTLAAHAQIKAKERQRLKVRAFEEAFSECRTEMEKAPLEATNRHRRIWIALGKPRPSDPLAGRLLDATFSILRTAKAAEREEAWAKTLALHLSHPRWPVSAGLVTWGHERWRALVADPNGSRRDARAGAWILAMVRLDLTPDALSLLTKAGASTPALKWVPTPASLGARQQGGASALKSQAVGYLSLLGNKNVWLSKERFGDSGSVTGEAVELATLIRRVLEAPQKDLGPSYLAELKHLLWEIQVLWPVAAQPARYKALVRSKLDSWLGSSPRLAHRALEQLKVTRQAHDPVPAQLEARHLRLLPVANRAKEVAVSALKRLKGASPLTPQWSFREDYVRLARSAFNLLLDDAVARGDWKTLELLSKASIEVCGGNAGHMLNTHLPTLGAWQHDSASYYAPLLRAHGLLSKHPLKARLAVENFLGGFRDGPNLTSGAAVLLTAEAFLQEGRLEAAEAAAGKVLSADWRRYPTWGLFLKRRAKEVVERVKKSR